MSNHDLSVSIVIYWPQSQCHREFNDKHDSSQYQLWFYCDSHRPHREFSVIRISSMVRIIYRIGTSRYIGIPRLKTRSLRPPRRHWHAQFDLLELSTEPLVTSLVFWLSLCWFGRLAFWPTGILVSVLVWAVLRFCLVWGFVSLGVCFVWLLGGLDWLFGC